MKKIMKKDIFIGVDGGGTKTKVLIEDFGGNKIGEAVGGAANIRLSVKESWNSINNAIDKALKNTSITLDDKNYNFHIGLGLAGVSIIEAKKEFLRTPHKFSSIILESDAHIACLAAHDGKDGSIVSIGTGVIGYSISSGKTYRVGGWGFPHADTGGGAWLGMEAVRLTFSSVDGCIKPSILTDLVFSHFGNDLSKFVTWANSSNSTQFAKLAPFVIEAMRRNDQYAVDLLSKAAKEVDLLVKALVEKSASALSCYLLGGISPFLVPYIMSGNNIFLCEDSKSAAKGAIYLIRNYYNK
jgi:glucosamine kinase